MSSINLRAIQKASFLNPSALEHHLLNDLNNIYSAKEKISQDNSNEVILQYYIKYLILSVEEQEREKQHKRFTIFGNSRKTRIRCSRITTP